MAVTELVTKILLKGQTDPSLTRAIREANSEVSGSIEKLKKFGTTASKVMKVTAGAIGAGLVASTKSAIDYESAFAGVKKTVEETETTKYEDISNAIRNMAKTMPATTTEIAAVAEAAGQLGIKADNISKFTEVMVNLGTTTNLSSEEAATAIAKMFNITGTSMDNVDRFGATIVALGNNAATTEADIVNMATRIASSGKQIGLTEQQILAMSTSLSSVGLEAEAGGTAISTIMSNIDKSVALNDETLTTWASTAGMTASQFKKAWETDAYGSMQKIIQGMGDTTANGGNLNILLEELGITGIRTADTMKRLSSASGLMTDMTNLANNAWDENTALTNEASTRYATTASQLQIFKNKINDVGIQIGSAVLPHLNKLLDKMSNIDFDAVADKVVVVIGKIADVFKWMSDHSTELLTIISMVAGAFAAVKILGFVTAIINIVKWVSTLVKMFGFLKVALAFLGGPVTIVVAVIGALVAAFVVLWKKSDKFRNFWINLWNKIKEIAAVVGPPLIKFFTQTLPKAFTTLINKCKSVFGAIKNFFTVTIPNVFKSVVSFFKSNWKSLLLMLVNPVAGIFKLLYDNCDGFRNIVNKVVEWVKTAFGNIVDFFASLPSKIGSFISNVWNKIVTWGANLWNKAKEIGKNFINNVISFFQQLPYKIGYIIGFCVGKVIMFGKKIIDFFKQLPSKIWSFLTMVVQKVVAWGTNIINTGKTKASQFFNAVVSFFAKLPSRIWTFLTNIVQKIIAWGTNVVNTAKLKISQFFNAVVSFFSRLPGRVWSFLSNTANKVVMWGTRVVNTGKAKITAFLNSVINVVKQLPSKVWNFLKNCLNKVTSWGSQLVSKGKKAATDLKDSIVNAIKGLPDKMTSIGKNIVEGLWNGIKNAKEWVTGKVKDFAGGILDGIKDACGINSPSKITMSFGEFIGKGLGIGIENTQKFVGKTVGAMGSLVSSGFSKVAPVISPIIGAVKGQAQKITTGGLAEKIKGKIQKYGNGGTVTHPQTAIVGDAPETIVPHGNTPRNRALLSEAAAGVGAPLGGSTTVNITFSPVINGGNAEENRKMLLEEEEAFERKMDEYFAKKGRLAF